MANGSISVQQFLSGLFINGSRVDDYSMQTSSILKVQSITNMNDRQPSFQIRYERCLYNLTDRSKCSYDFCYLKTVWVLFSL